MKTTVIYHSADFDGIFCREIAHKFLGADDVEYIGWNFGDPTLEIPSGRIYVLDLPVDRVFGFTYKPEDVTGNPPQHPEGLIWIDHHQTSIATHPSRIPGYRIDGVAACRLAWQWFLMERGEHDGNIRVNIGGVDVVNFSLPSKQDFVDRKVYEPWSVRLAGEYDIWDKRDPDAELFQHGLRSRVLSSRDWSEMLEPDQPATATNMDAMIEAGVQGVLKPDGTLKNHITIGLLRNGTTIQFVRDNEYREVITSQGFDIEFEGLKFLACCSHECDIRSHLFVAGIKPHHEALFGFTYTGKDWRVSLYHAPGKEHHDLSLIAKKHGGGGHRGACGFISTKLPFLNQQPN